MSGPTWGRLIAGTEASGGADEIAIENNAPKSPSAQEDGHTPAHTVTVRLPNGDLATVVSGRNDFPELRLSVWVRKDGGTSLQRWATNAPPGKPKAKDEVAPTQIHGSAGSPTPLAPPLSPGHELSTKHGATSPRRVEPLAQAMVDTVLEHAPFLSEPSFDRALRAWARAEARCALLDDWLDEHGLLDEGGAPRPAAEFARKQEELALKHRTRLGLDAASRATIEASLTGAAASRASLDQLLAQGAESVRARRLAQEPPAAPLDSPGLTGAPASAGQTSGSQIATGEDR